MNYLDGKSPSIWIPNEKVRDNSTKSGEMHHLGDYWPFEEYTLRAYWGHYFSPKEKVGLVSTTNSILNAYMRLRNANLMTSLMNPANPNFFYKRDILWQWLIQNEPEMNLPFKSRDGREGKPFASAMPDYAELTLNNKANIDNNGGIL